MEKARVNSEMAGKPKNTVTYFPHYVNSSRTVFILTEKYQDRGYAFWFRLLELLASTDGHFYTCKDDLDMMRLVKATCNNAIPTSENIIFTNEIISLLVDRGKIDRDLWEKNRIIWCQNIVDNLADVYRNRRRPLPEKPKLHVESSISTGNLHVPTGNLHVENAKLHVEQEKLHVEKGKTTLQSRVEYSKVDKSRGEYNARAREENKTPPLDYFEKCTKFGFGKIWPLWSQKRTAKNLSISHSPTEPEKQALRSLSEISNFNLTEIDKKIDIYLSKNSDYLGKRNWPLTIFSDDYNELSHGNTGGSTGKEPWRKIYTAEDFED